MRKSISIFLAVAGCLGIALTSMAAEPAADGAAKPSMSDSPYKSGPPPITGGYTDTSQGGTKGSGDASALPPGIKPPAPGSAPAEAKPTPGKPSGR